MPADAPLWMPLAVGTALGCVSLVLLVSRYMSELRQLHWGWFGVVAVIIVGGYVAALWPYDDRDKLALLVAPALWTTFVVGLLPQSIIMYRVVERLRAQPAGSVNAV